MVNAAKLDGELRAAGIPIDGVSSGGRVDFREQATAEQRDAAAAILAAHDPMPAPGTREVLVSELEAAATLAAVKAALVKWARARG